MPKVIAFRHKPTPDMRFQMLLEPHFDALYSSARRMTLCQHDAEDLVQDVCIRAFERLDELEQIEYPRAWLMKVMYNLFVDDTRRMAKSPIRAAWTGEDSPEPDEFASNQGLPEELTAKEQRIERVLRAMRCLSADQCALVAMHDVEGMSIDELSQLTGRPAGTIKSQLHRIRKKLGRLLRNEAIAKPLLRVIGGKQ